MNAKAVGQRIKAAREKKSMTQEDLAARINISPTHVSVIERGTKIPRIREIGRHRKNLYSRWQ